MRYKLALGLAAGLRAGLILWGAYQDAHSPVPYTDVDYFVFSDAAACLVHPSTPNCRSAQGLWAKDVLGDPYARSTYRYTPLLALLLLPNSLVHQAFGKILFAFCDLLVGVLLYRLSLRRGLSERKASNAVTALWLLNPIIANISTRGSSESVIGAIVVTTLYLAETGRWDAAALAYGLAVHLKIFPVVYGSSMLAALLRPKELRLSFVRMARFGIVSFASFAALTTILFLLYVFRRFPRILPSRSSALLSMQMGSTFPRRDLPLPPQAS
jgi:phosphatidylinositol glycan class M